MNDALRSAGFDGNGRFRSTGGISDGVAGIMEEHGIQFDEAVTAWTFNQPEGNATFDIAMRNEADPFSPESIENSMVSIYWYKHETDGEGLYEAVVYLS